MQVLATHPYNGEDEDELSFEKGDMVAVVPYDDPEDEVGNSGYLVWSCSLVLFEGFLLGASQVAPPV